MPQSVALFTAFALLTMHNCLCRCLSVCVLWVANITLLVSFVSADAAKSMIYMGDSLRYSRDVSQFHPLCNDKLASLLIHVFITCNCATM
jgi:hypothetical protein